VAILDVNRVETYSYATLPIPFNNISGVLLYYEVLAWLPWRMLACRTWCSV